MSTLDSREGRIDTHVGVNVHAVECTLDLGEVSLLLGKAGLRTSRCRPSILQRGLDTLEVSRQMREDVRKGQTADAGSRDGGGQTDGHSLGQAGREDPRGDESQSPNRPDDLS